MAQLKIPLDAQRFSKGLSWKDYMAQMGDTRARTEDYYSKSALNDDERKFFASVNDELGLAFVVIMHLAPDQPSALSEILAARTRMPVHQVDHSAHLVIRLAG